MELRYQQAARQQLQQGRQRCHEARTGLTQLRAERLPDLRLHLERNLHRLQQSLVAQPPRLQQRLQQLQSRLRLQQQERLAPLRHHLEQSATHLELQARRRHELLSQRLRLASRQLTALNPLAVLSRGYSITRLAGSDRILRQAADAPAGALLETRLHEGVVSSRVEPAS